MDAPPLTPDEALAKMEHFCAYRERCPKEVRQKMAELRLPKDLADQLYHLLEQESFFNERRFTEMYVLGKFRSNNWGRIRIQLELKMRDIAPSLVEEAFLQIDEKQYSELIVNLLNKKIKQFKGDSDASRKAAASVIRAGFEPELVFRSLQMLKKDQY